MAARRAAREEERAGRSNAPQEESANNDAQEDSVNDDKQQGPANDGATAAVDGSQGSGARDKNMADSGSGRESPKWNEEKGDMNGTEKKAPAESPDALMAKRVEECS